MTIVLVTGVAGFVGAAVAHRLLDEGNDVVGIDNLNPYYDVALKRARLDRLLKRTSFRFEPVDITDADALKKLVGRCRPTRIVHLAAQPGVRFSVDNAAVSVAINVNGFLNMLEACKDAGIEHLVFASSSSVYGASREIPFSTSQATDTPLSVYAATKKANELLAYSYAHLFGLRVTGLRFFTVYGPWGRPDMAPIIFAKALLEGRPLKLFNGGDMRRDFTYVDDIVEGVVRVLMRAPECKPAFKVYNIGNGRTVALKDFVAVLERCIGKPAMIEYAPMQAGDVVETQADVSDLVRDFGYSPTTSVEEGVHRFVEWYKEYYGPR